MRDVVTRRVAARLGHHSRTITHLVVVVALVTSAQYERTRAGSAVAADLARPAPSGQFHESVTNVVGSVTSAGGGAETINPSHRALVTWARQRFVAAGLRVPTPVVVFLGDPEDCGGHSGRYQRAIDRVSICMDDSADDLVRRKLMLHELGHAWTHETLTDDERAAFVELRGASSWNDHDDPWAERGTEHASELLAWGLMDIATDPSHIEPSDDSSLRLAFTTLTGVPPINDGSHPASDRTEPSVVRLTRR